MTFKAMLDCWASLVLCRAGGEWDAPTLDAALGTEELQREWISAAEARMAGWAEADASDELMHEEALALGVVQALRKIMEGNAPKRGGKSRPAQVHSKFGDKGGLPAVMEAGLEVDLILRDFSEKWVLAEGVANDDERLAAKEVEYRALRKLRLIEECIMRCHPRRGPYSGLPQKGSPQWRNDSRYRMIVSALCRFESTGTLDLRRLRKVFEPKRAVFDPV